MISLVYYQTLPFNQHRKISLQTLPGSTLPWTLIPSATPHPRPAPANPDNLDSKLINRNHGQTILPDVCQLLRIKQATVSHASFPLATFTCTWSAAGRRLGRYARDDRLGSGEL